MYILMRFVFVPWYRRNHSNHRRNHSNVFICQEINLSLCSFDLNNKIFSMSTAMFDGRRRLCQRLISIHYSSTNTLCVPFIAINLFLGASLYWIHHIMNVLRTISHNNRHYSAIYGPVDKRQGQGKNRINYHKNRGRWNTCAFLLTFFWILFIIFTLFRFLVTCN